VNAIESLLWIIYYTAIVASLLSCGLLIVKIVIDGKRKWRQVKRDQEAMVHRLW